MKPDTLRKISVVTRPEAEEAITALLEQITGQPAVSFCPAESQEIVVTVYCPASFAWSTQASQTWEDGVKRLGTNYRKTSIGKIKFNTLRREDWAESWKKHFPPLVINSKLLVKPSWSRRRPRPDQAVIILDPGLSFGTGHHPTTGFCLRQLTIWRSQTAQSFLDLGTGTGILAIAAAKLGYHPVEALDFDPEAVGVARENARRNQVLYQIRFSRKDLRGLPFHSRRRYNVICANMEFDLLMAETGRILNRLLPDGALILAGILNQQFQAVKHQYASHGLRLAEREKRNEWSSGTFIRSD